MSRFPKDCWSKACPYFHTWELSVDDLCCACELLEAQCDECDEDASMEICPLEEGGYHGGQ